MTRVRLGVVRDFHDEGWPSMDLCADQLLAVLPPEIAAVDVAPRFRRLCGSLPSIGGIGFNADRLLNRHLLLPRLIHRLANRFDFVHIADHSYAHVASALPVGRAGVYCHDLDAFRCLLEPAKEPRPWWFRRLARRTLDGLKRAAVVFHSTMVVRDRLLNTGIADEERLIYAPYGVAAEFTPERTRPVVLPVSLDAPYLLHVGSNIPRKRPDVLLAVFAEVRLRIPGVRLLQVGGTWTPQLVEQIARLGIGAATTQLRGLSREQLGELYRRAVVVLVPSEAEGFGLPVIEGLACGASVVASDIPTLREVGGDVVDYCPVADVPAWVDAFTRAVIAPSPAANRAVRIAHAAKFSWREHARVIADAYLRLAGGIGA